MALIVGLSVLAPSTAVRAEPGADAETFEAVRAADLRLATIGWRLASANAALCDRLEAGTGLQLHTLDQFDSGAREAARRHFHFDSPVAVEGVVPGTPAAQAGLRPDDSLVRVGSVDIAKIPGKPQTTDRLVAVQLAIAALPATAPISVVVVRGGETLQATLQPVPVCKSRFELILGSSFTASADGTMVKIGAPFLETYDEDAIAAVVAHEFSHNILHHRDRLEARGVNFGLLSGFGGNVKYFRQTELQADLLSVYLLANAGYPVDAPIRFWKRFGPSKASSIFNSRSHPHWRDRVAMMEAEIARIGDAPRPVVPSAMLAERDGPLSGDWQSLLARR